MAFIKKNWKDRISQFPNRRTINDGNVTKQVTVGRDEGAITEEGDAFNSANMNDLEQRIEDAYGDVAALVADEVANQYDSANVIFDAEPTEGHGTGYTVTSEGIKNAIDSGLVQTKTVSGSIVHITDGADNIPVKNLEVDIQYQQASGTPTPSSPLPITTFNACDLVVCGKNLLNNPDITTTGGSYVINNVNVPMVAGKYVLSFNFSGTSNSSSLRIDDENGTAIFTITKTIIVGRNEYLINLPSKGAFVKLFSNAVGTYTDFQIEKGEMATNYEPYNGSQYASYFEGLLNGTYGFVDLGTLNWTKYANGQFYSAYDGIANFDKTTNNAICPIYTLGTWSEWNNSTKDKIICGVSPRTIYIKDTAYTDATAFTNAMNGVYLIYELATPTTPTITQSQMNTLISAFDDTFVCVVFGQQVAKGKLNIKTGVLTITHGVVEYDGSADENWGKNGDYYYIAVDNAFKTPYTVIANEYLGVSPRHYTSLNNNECALSSVYDYLNIKDTNGYATAGDYRVWLSNNNLTVIYKYVTPVVVQLSPTEVKTLLGENNIYANTGDIDTLIYYVDAEAIYAIRDVIDEFAMQSDWNEADNTKADYIKNKPTIPANADFSLSGLSDTDISGESVGQVLAFDGDNWVNSSSLSDKIDEFSTWKTSTISFSKACESLGIYSGMGAVLDNLETNVGGYSDQSLNNRVDASQGPVYFMLVGKANNSYYTGILMSYFYNDTSRQPIMFTYSNGTYAVKRI